jgi:malate dehydrogenase (oxaloacetate-decarboxylating)
MRAAASALGDPSPPLSDPGRPLLPAFEDLPEITTRIATAVAIQAVRDGVAPEASDDQLASAVRGSRWTPEYATR